MTTSADGRTDDTVPSGPIGSADAQVEALSDLARRIRHRDSRERHRGLVTLAELLAGPPATGGPDPADLAALLPDSLSGPPETALLLADLYERLRSALPPQRPIPDWRSAELPPGVRIAWLRTELHVDPTALHDEPPGETLYQAVRQLTAAGARRPERLVAALAGHGDPVLHAEALRLARDGLHAGLLSPALARGHVIGLLGSADDGVVAEALAELTAPWAALDPLPSTRLSPFLDAGAADTRPAVADAALAAAARHGHPGLPRGVLEDPDRSPGLRRRALELLGDLADRDDITDLVAVAARDPLLLGGPALACLRGLHRRGHFAADTDVPAVIGLALADHSIAPREVATVLFTCRRAMLHTLADAPADDPSWPRRLALLLALDEQGAGELPIGAAITRVLPSAPAPEPFLHAIGALRHPAAEEAVIALLPTAPAAALDTLEVIGGRGTAAALWAGLGLATTIEAAASTEATDRMTGASPSEGPDAIAPHLRAVRSRALALLWHLSDEPARRGALLARLDPAELPERIAVDLGGPDERELAVLAAHLDPDRPAVALRRLADHGGAGALPALADLLLRVVSELAAAAEPGGPVVPPDESGRPAGEPAVPEEVLDALRALGGRLYERGRIRPVCLLDAADARQAGDALAATMALDLLDRPHLSGGERAVLLELLLRTPYSGTRARVHRLLRDRDRHVRKHVITLLALDEAADGAQALSASLTALTAAPDIQTVRSALLALGRARALWAAPAIAACLDHPTMNIKRTAAEALIRAGTPAAVPALLHWLGHHDNPGLHASVAAALRAVLGDAYAATVLAAAEQAVDGRVRGLLLAGLGGVLTAHAVRSLAEQDSPLAPALLAAVAAGEVQLSAGTVADLAEELDRHNIPAPVRQPTSADNGADSDARTLVDDGWDPVVAVRLATRAARPGPAQLRDLRPTLPHWLRLAESDNAARPDLLRFALRLCPAPLSDGEPAAFARAAPLLLDALPAADDADRRDLLAVLEEAAPLLRPSVATAVADTVRALPPKPGGGRSTLALLRRCGAVPVRADLDRALAAARLDADPWRAESSVLREAFGIGAPAGEPTAETEVWRSALADAVRAPDALAALRRRDGDPPGTSRERLAAMVEAHTAAEPGVRGALLDWMAALQPLDAPPWTIAESARPASSAPRAVHADDLDQPRSAALRGRLLAMLAGDDPARRAIAAEALLTWPEPEARLPVLRAFLRGRVETPVDAGLARLLTEVSEPELRSEGIRHDRVVLAARELDPHALEPLVPMLLDWWEQDPPAVRASIAAALGGVPADVLAERLGRRLGAGSWGFLTLLSGRPLLRTPALERVRERLRAEGHADLAAGLDLVDGPLRGPGAGDRDAAALAALRQRPAPSARPGAPSRRELLDLARTGPPEQVRRALARLAEIHGDPRSGPAGPDPELLELLGALLRHPRPKIRLLAHRTLRSVADRPTYLDHTMVLLADPQPDVVRTAIRALSHGAWAPAVPAMVGLLDHAHPVVRAAAADGLAGIGAPAVPVLRRAADHARPDRRSRYMDLLDRIASAEE